MEQDIEPLRWRGKGVGIQMTPASFFTLSLCKGEGYFVATLLVSRFGAMGEGVGVRFTPTSVTLR